MLKFNIHILSIVTWLPVLGGIIIIALFKKDKATLIKRFATVWLGLDFVASLYLWFRYDSGLGGMQFLEDHQWIPVIGARYQMGADGVSVLLILLTTLLGVIAALSSWEYIQKREKEYYALLLFLQAAVLGVFSSMDMFLFYLFFEVSLVPMYFLVGIWGGENRLYAAIKFFLYTLVGSVVMLLGILKMYFLTQDPDVYSKITPATINLLAGNPAAAAIVNNTVTAAAHGGTFNIIYLQAMGSVLPMDVVQVLLFFAFALGFAIKVPMFPFHTWLPDAHVEAPTAGSVILAGILLKLGTYGFYRFNIPMFPAASIDEKYFGSFGVRSVMIFLAIISIIYGALAAMYFVVKKDGDVKKLVAYSSVSSMGVVMLGLFALNPNGLNGAVMQMINHGIYSAALFLLVGIIYERRHTRNVAEFGGLSHVMPGYAAVFLAMVMTAIGLPLLAVFISEFLALRGAFEANPFWAGWGTLGIILNAGYFLWLYQRMFFGTVDNPKNQKLSDLNWREWVYMTPLLILSLWIGCYPKVFMNYISKPVNAVVKQVRPAYPIPGMTTPSLPIDSRTTGQPLSPGQLPQGFTIQPH
ncbi:MAG: proton-translocating NADH-quinone oxidoreductase, chain [Acidobacteria bacterium]|nr:proton-translocating NADH-quinone oxidoreductase, chain [Acidobacteriota bacterium]